MSRFTDATMVAVQVETNREQVWVQDGISPGQYPGGGIAMLDLLATRDDVEMRNVTTPFAGKGLFATPRKDEPISDATVATSVNLNVDYDGIGSARTVKDVSVGTVTSTVAPDYAMNLGPVVVQTRMPIPVSPGDTVNFAGQFAIRRSSTPLPKDSNDNSTGVSVVCTLFGITRTEDEYGTVGQISTPLLQYSSNFQPTAGFQQTIHTLPVVSPAVVPAGVSEVHLTIWLRANTTSEPISMQYLAKKAGVLYIGMTWNYFTFSNANPLTLTVTPQAVTPGVPAATWQTLTQEQNRIYRYTYETVTGEVAEIETERIEADLSVTTIRFASSTISTALAAGKRVRVLALHPGGGFTVIVAGRVRARRVVPNVRGESLVEIAVHDSHGRLGEPCSVAFDTFAKYKAVLNRLGVPVSIDGVDVSGPPRALPPWGGSFPSYWSEDLTYLDSLLMVRNTRKGFVRITREDRLEVLTALPAGVALDVSDLPGQADMSYSIDAEFGSDTADLVNAVRVTENLLDSESFTDRYVGSEDPPLKLDYIEGRNQSAEYRRAASVEAVGLASRTFPVVRGTGSWADIQAENYGTNFAAWASAILDEYSVEQTGPRAITLPVVTAEQRARVAALEVLDAVVVRHKGVAYVRRIRRVSHHIKPGSWLVKLRFDVTGDQVFWAPTTAAPVVGPGTVKPYVPNPKPSDRPLAVATAGADGGSVDPPNGGTLDGGTP